MIRGLMNFFVFAGSTLLLPVFGFMAWGWGSSDEKFLMKATFCALGPFCADLWYLIVTHLFLRRQSSYLMQALIIFGGYAGIALLLRERVIVF